MRNTACLLCAIAATASGAGIDLETNVPAGWSVGGSGSLSISPDHYRLGSESLRWSWQGGDVLTASGVSIDPAKVLGFYQNTCSLWLYSDTAATGDELTIEFLDGSGAVQWRFVALLNFEGWRHLVRSYRYDMEQVGGGTDLQAVRFTAPASGSGSLFFDDIEWVGERVTRHRDRVMPDIDGYSSSTLFHDLDHLAPDLPPDPATPAELAALPQVEAALWASLDASAPSVAAVTTAKATFASWNIVRSGGGIKGAPVDRDSVGSIDPFLGVLARAWIHLGDSEALDMAIDTIDHLIDQGWAGGSAESADGGSDTYATREIVRALVMLRDEYTPGLRADVEDLLQWRLKRGFFWDPAVAERKDTDYMHTESLGLMGLALGFADTDQEKVENLRGLRQYFERFLVVTSSGTGGIKPDGTGFHHWNHYNNYMYAFGQLAERLYLLRDTPFMVDRESYEIFRDSCYMMAMMCNDIEFANSLSGRKPASPGLPINATTFARLAKAGGPFLGQTADPKLARFHNRVWGGDADLLPYGNEVFPTGFRQLNFSPAGIYRHGSSVVTIRGLTDTFWGTEIYPDSNRYGRYQAYGSVEVMYPGGRAASGFDLDGWDWNSPPGTTVVRLPFPDLKAAADRQDELADTRFCGALACDLDPNGEFGVKGGFGFFGMEFRQRAISATHDPSFTFRKSVFASDGLLLCLGSDIANDDAAHETITNLFQVSLPAPTTPTNHMGSDLTGFPSSDHWSGGTRWFVDHLGTGYYLPDGQDVHLERSSQSSPSHTGTGGDSSGDFAKAWISHGTQPSGGSYEFVVVPETDSAGMQQLAGEMAGSDAPFEVLRQDASAHIVDLRRDGARAYVCFGAIAGITHGPVAETSGPALIATRQASDHLVVTYANPELALGFRSDTPAGAVTTDVRLAGEWAMFSSHPHCQLISAGPAGTTLRFTTSEGNPVEVGLVGLRATPGVIATSGDFSQQVGALLGWFSSGGTPAGILRTVSAMDGEEGTYDTAGSDGPGDGVAGDGALLFDSANAVSGDEEISYIFGGTMDVSESYTLDIACFNPNSSYNSYSVSLWNRTDGVELATSGSIGLSGNVTGCRETTLVVSPSLADQGDQLEIRIREFGNNIVRDIAVDSFSLEVGASPADTGWQTIADLRLPEAAFPSVVSYFDPGFGPLGTRDVPTTAPVGLSVGFSGTTQSPGGPTPDSATDLGLRTYPATTNIVNLNRYASSTDGGASGLARVGAVQWSVDLSPVAAYLDASGKQLDGLELRLVAHPNDATRAYDVYLSYESPADGISLSSISPDNAAANYADFFWPSRGAVAGDFVGGTHKVLALDHTGDLDLGADLAAVFGAGARQVNLILVSGGFFSGRTIEVGDGSGITFRASLPHVPSPFEEFMAGYPALVGSDALAGADPDGDGLCNVAEFLFGGSSPASAAEAHRPVGAWEDGHLTLSFLVPGDPVFSGSPAPSASIHGVLTAVEGASGLADFVAPVEETSVDPSLPPSPGGYSWRAFRLQDSGSSAPRGFLRIHLEIP